MVGIITELCKRAGVAQHSIDVMVKCDHKVNPQTMERFSRPRLSQPQVGRGPQDDVEEEEPLVEQPHQEEPMPDPNFPRAHPWIDLHHGHIVRQNEFIMSALMRQQTVNAHFKNYQVGMVVDINAMVARMNINEQVRPPRNFPTFE